MFTQHSRYPRFATISPGQINKNARLHKKLITANTEERNMHIRYYTLPLSLVAALPWQRWPWKTSPTVLSKAAA